jgi:hypothetical protein
MWSVVSRRLAAPSKLWLMSSTPSAPQLLDQATGKKIATVEELRALCNQAQCGVRNVTVTDLNVRKTLRAPPGKVGVEWAGLQAALAQLEREGLLRGPVTAELHDVLLYSPGDFFKPHVDTKKGPKHLMTLAVDAGLCPPCRGGELVLATDKDGSEEWLPRGGGSFCAWYTNVVHEVMPLLSGNRCVAVYNVSAEAANTDQFENQKLDLIVDALRQLLLIKSASILENLTKTHIGFSLNGRYSSFAMDNVKVVPRSNLFGADEVLLKALEHGFGVPKEDLQVLVAVKVGDYTADYFNGATEDVRFEDVPSVTVGFADQADLSRGDEDLRKPVGGRFRTTWFMNEEPKFEEQYIGYVQGNDAGDPEFAYHCSYLRVPRKYFPELNVPRKRGRCAEGGEEDQQGKTAGPGKDTEEEAPDKSGSSK